MQYLAAFVAILRGRFNQSGTIETRAERASAAHGRPQRAKFAENPAPPRAWLGGNLHLDGEMRERSEPRQPGAVVVRVAVLLGHHRDDGPEMAGTQAPQMQV